MSNVIKFPKAFCESNVLANLDELNNVYYLPRGYVQAKPSAQCESSTEIHNYINTQMGDWKNDFYFWLFEIEDMKVADFNGMWHVKRLVNRFRNLLEEYDFDTIDLLFEEKANKSYREWNDSQIERLYINK